MKYLKGVGPCCAVTAPAEMEGHNHKKGSTKVVKIFSLIRIDILLLPIVQIQQKVFISSRCW